MKILNCEVQNFGSYKSLEFTFKDKDLCLVSGPTGSGKSTLCDIIPWILFGRTAKGGTVDEILNWTAAGKTTGCITVELRGKLFQVLRTRKPNDLMIWEDGGSYRGKDATDTQNIINNKLGFNFDLYMSGAYFNEFSQTAEFFTTTAKHRRELIEQLVDLSLPVKIKERATDYKKEVQTQLKEYQYNLSLKGLELKLCNDAVKSDKALELSWNVTRRDKINELQAKVDDYKNHHEKQLNKALRAHKKQQEALESDLLELEKSLVPEANLAFYRATLNEEKQQLELTKNSKCPVCGSQTNKDKEILMMNNEFSLKKREDTNDYTKKLLNLKVRELSRHNELQKNLTEAHSNNENPYIKQLEALRQEENPYTKVIAKRSSERETIAGEEQELRVTVEDFTRERADLELLLEVTESFRSVLIKNTVVDLEVKTNSILNEYFDAEIQVKFELADSDKLVVTIRKDDNECTFTQLSKGQRQLLKLAFSVSIMKCVSNHHGVDFNCLFFDEALDGLDDVLKVKAYDLLQRLGTEHESVFVVEHNEALKTMFPKRFEVILTDEGSQLAET